MYGLSRGKQPRGWLRSLGDSLQDLLLESDDSGGIVATRVMPDAHVVPGLVKIDGYSAPDAQLALSLPQEVSEAVTYGRPIAGAASS
jgi:hypothetical protein